MLCSYEKWESVFVWFGGGYKYIHNGDRAWIDWLVWIVPGECYK